MNDSKLCWGIDCRTMNDGAWSFGVCLSHMFDETYIYINFFKWSIAIGRIYKEVTYETN